MGRFNRIINVNDTLYECLGTQDVSQTDIKGTEYWKKCWGADNVLRNGHEYYFVRLIINAEFQDI